MFINAAMIVSGKQAEPSTSAPVAPVETSVSPAATFVPGSEDPFGTDADVAALDSMLTLIFLVFF
jgi:hypothetical protein